MPEHDRVTYPLIEVTQPEFTDVDDLDGVIRFRVSMMHRVVSVAGLFPMVTFPCHDEPIRRGEQR